MKIESLFQHRSDIGQIGDEIVHVREYSFDLRQQTRRKSRLSYW